MEHNDLLPSATAYIVLQFVPAEWWRTFITPLFQTGNELPGDSATWTRSCV